MWEKPKELAIALRTARGNIIDLPAIMVLLADVSWKRCPATVTFSNENMNSRQLAFAKPDAPLDWVRYTIFVRPFLENDVNGLQLVLAHELCHVTFGKLAGEEESDNFAAALLGMNYENYREAIRAYESNLISYLSTLEQQGNS